MKKRQTHILKDDTIFVGLEDSKRTWKLCVRSSRLSIHETSMPAKYENLRNYFHNKFPGCEITVMYEAGFRGFGLYDSLVEDGFKCVVTPPHTVVDEKCNRVKNDRIDSRRLAKNLENQDYKQCFVFDKQHREDRQLVRTYEQIKKDITRTKNRIRREIEFHGIDQLFPPGKWKESNYKRLLSMVANKDFALPVTFSLEVKFAQLEMLKQLKKATHVQLIELCKSERYKKSVDILKSAPGIGSLTAIFLTLEWGDVSRFETKEKFVKFFGLIPSENSTGEREGKGHITKQGNGQVRCWLVESSWVAIKKDPVLLKKYSRVLNNSGSGKKAIVAVARKFAIRLRAILLTEQMYELGVVE